MFTTTFLFTIFLSTILHCINGEPHNLNEEKIIELIQSGTPEAQEETVAQLKIFLGQICSTETKKHNEKVIEGIEKWDPVNGPILAETVQKVLNELCQPEMLENPVIDLRSLMHAFEIMNAERQQAILVAIAEFLNAHSKKDAERIDLKSIEKEAEEEVCFVKISIIC